MNNEETLPTEQTNVAASIASNTDVSTTDVPRVDNAPVADSEIQSPSVVEPSSSEVSPVAVVSDAESTTSDTTQPVPIVTSEPAMFANVEATPNVAPITPETPQATSSDESTTPDVVQTPEPTPQQPALQGDAVYTDHHGNKHGAFIEHIIAGGVRLIAQLRLALGDMVDEVPHSADGEPHSWHRN
jgi:hypothetical protein